MYKINQLGPYQRFDADVAAVAAPSMTNVHFDPGATIYPQIFNVAPPDRYTVATVQFHSAAYILPAGKAFAVGLPLSKALPGDVTDLALYQLSGLWKADSQNPNVRISPFVASTNNTTLTSTRSGTENPCSQYALVNSRGDESVISCNAGLVIRADQDDSKFLIGGFYVYNATGGDQTIIGVLTIDFERFTEIDLTFDPDR